MENRKIEDVTDYIDKHIDKWLHDGYAPWLKTFMEMEQAVFVDVNSYEFESILKSYCKDHHLSLRIKQKWIERKIITCFLFTKK